MSRHEGKWGVKKEMGGGGAWVEGLARHGKVNEKSGLVRQLHGQQF